MENKYLYTISHPDTKEIVYVGASAYVEERAKQHMTTNQNQELTDFIYSLVVNCKRPLFTVLFEMDENWRETERDYIIKLIEEGCPLLNKQIRGYRNKDYQFDIIDLTEGEDQSC